MNTIKAIVFASATMLLPISVAADWDGGLEGGTVLQDGGSATRLRLKLSNNQRPLSHFIYADWIRSDSNQSSYELGYKPRYWFSQRIYGFAEASLRQDRPLAIDRSTTVLGGFGVQLAASDSTGIFAEAGLGQRIIEFSNPFISVSDTGVIEMEDSTEETIALARLGLFQILSGLLKLELDADIFSGESLVQSTAEAGISLRVPSGSVKVSYRTRRIEVDGSEPVDDADTSISFSYGF